MPSQPNTPMDLTEWILVRRLKDFILAYGGITEGEFNNWGRGWLRGSSSHTKVTYLRWAFYYIAHAVYGVPLQDIAVLTGRARTSHSTISTALSLVERLDTNHFVWHYIRDIVNNLSKISSTLPAKRTTDANNYTPIGDSGADRLTGKEPTLIPKHPPTAQPHGGPLSSRSQDGDHPPKKGHAPLR